jgi:tRNA modification GTPase
MAKASSSGWSSVLAGGADTIVARASGSGRGALAVVRVSGRDTRRIAEKVCPEIAGSMPWQARLVSFRGADELPIERGVAILYHEPRSHTGEDMLEASVHGSPYIVNELVEAFVAAGARPAGPGEFTRRAVANGKLDLLQAEAVRDLIGAQTARQADNARRQLTGALSADVRRLREALVALSAQLEGALDFEDQGVRGDPAGWSLERGRCRRLIADMLATSRSGERIRDGVRVVIIGPPNSGKSTLFNRLLGTERAIVTTHPGTTRDVVEGELELDGLRVVLADTAGLRATADPVEREGVRRAEAAVASAQVVVELWPSDAAEAAPEERPGAPQPRVRVRSKADLAEGTRPACAEGWLWVSCVTGEGLEALRGELRARVTAEVDDLGGRVAIATRHRRALQRADDELASVGRDQPEILAEAVRWALREVRELTGEVATEDVLDEVFRTFCVGK